MSLVSAAAEDLQPPVEVEVEGGIGRAGAI